MSLVHDDPPMDRMERNVLAERRMLGSVYAMSPPCGGARDWGL